MLAERALTAIQFLYVFGVLCMHHVRALLSGAHEMRVQRIRRLFAPGFTGVAPPM